MLFMLKTFNSKKIFHLTFMKMKYVIYKKNEKYSLTLKTYSINKMKFMIKSIILDFISILCLDMLFYRKFINPKINHSFIYFINIYKYDQLLSCSMSVRSNIL